MVVCDVVNCVAAACDKVKCNGGKLRCGQEMW